MKKIKAGVIGATGYAGFELVRLLLTHPQVEISAVSSVSYEGKRLCEIYPQLTGICDLKLESDEYVTSEEADCDVVFASLPAGHSEPIARRCFDSGKLFIDMGADFRLKDERLAVFRRRKIGFIFQSYNLVPSLNVWENIVLPIGLDGRKVDQEYVMDIIRRIGMEDRLHALPNTLSGGQQQRVAIARALASRPAIILADEPTGNLDSRTEIEVVNLLKNCVTEYGQTLVMITHDESIAQMADRMIVIEDGKVVRA